MWMRRHTNYRTKETTPATLNQVTPFAVDRLNNLSMHNRWYIFTKIFLKGKINQFTLSNPIANICDSMRIENTWRFSIDNNFQLLSEILKSFLLT